MAPMLRLTPQVSRACAPLVVPPTTTKSRSSSSFIHRVEHHAMHSIAPAHAAQPDAIDL
jgi:hypothetical protein